MNNPWPVPQNDVPHGCMEAAVSLVRIAADLSKFEMTQKLGITVSELTECENTPRWPRSENARKKLIALADEIGFDIGQTKQARPEAEPSLF